MGTTTANIQRRRRIRAAEHKRDVLTEKLGKTKADLEKARLELQQVRKSK